MLKTRLIPILLYKDCRLVKSIAFDKLRNLGNPIQTVKVYNARNVDELIFLDIAATDEKRPPLFQTVSEISEECFMPLTVGGGIKTISDIRKLLKIGADKVSLNTHALHNPTLVQQAARIFGAQSIIVAIDVKQEQSGRSEVYTHRGKQATGIDPVSWAQQAAKLGAGELFITSIDRDGCMNGYDTKLIKQISSKVTVPVIAGGGAGKPLDFVQAVRNGACAVAASSIFHYTHYTPNMIKTYMKKQHIPVRI